MSLKNFYLAMTVVGTVIPWLFLGRSLRCTDLISCSSCNPCSSTVQQVASPPMC